MRTAPLIPAANQSGSQGSQLSGWKTPPDTFKKGVLEITLARGPVFRARKRNFPGTALTIVYFFECALFGQRI